MTDRASRVACPACQSRMKADPASVPEGGAGLKARCRQCGAAIRVRNDGGVLVASLIDAPSPKGKAAPRPAPRPARGPTEGGASKGNTTGSQELPLGALEAGDRIGRYEVEGILGRGGMGTVYNAYDPAANRPVALKVLSPHATDLDRMRFQREIEVQGNVQHPNIMPILDSGHVGNERYYVMELLKDPLDLAHVIDQARSGDLARDTKLRPLARLEGLVERILLPICEAVYHANVNEGVLHRDIKPTNIILDRAGLRPLLIDFGVSTLLDKSNARLAHLARELPIPLKGEGIRVTGTLVFMPPEQARGEADRRGDVWALGALLHYVLTGLPPLEQAIRPQVSRKERVQGLQMLVDMARQDGRDEEVREFERKIHEIRSGKERTVEDLQQDVLNANYAPRPPGISRELDAIIDRAMAKRPSDRYRHAMELHGDLSAWLGARPVKARVRSSGAAGGLVYRARLFLRRHAILLAAGVVILAGALFFLLQDPETGPDRRRQAEAQLAAAQKEADAGAYDKAHALARASIRLDPDADGAFALIERIRWAERFKAAMDRARALRLEAIQQASDGDLASLAATRAALTEVLGQQVRPRLAASAPPALLQELARLERLATGRITLTLEAVPAGATVSVLPLDPEGRVAWDAARVLDPSQAELTGGRWILRVAKGDGVVHVPFEVPYVGSGVTVRCPVDPGTLDARSAYVGGGQVQGPLGIRQVGALVWDAVEVSCARYARFLDSLPAAERAQRVPRTAGALGVPGRPLWEADGERFKPPAGAALRPVEGISYYDARAFAAFEKKRLPTSAEWAWAATGPDGRTCAVGPVGDLWKGVARVNLPGDGPGDARSKKADRSPFGIHDMAGSVAEFTRDLATLDGLSGWVVMGGSYLRDPARAVVTSGETVPGWVPLEGVGIRCVREP